MQLKKLWIKDYKNLKDFSLDFEKGNNLSILIGNNGSGKSNVLEAISGIFAEAYRNVSDLLETDYTLEYIIDEQDFKIEKKNGKRKVYNNDYPVTVKTHEFYYLPSNVIAIYSGEDLRLWENFYWQRYYEYLTAVYKTGYSGKMGMYYVNKYLWNISLFVLILFADDFENIKRYLTTEIGLSDFENVQIRIKFNYESYDKNKNLLLKSFTDKINPEKKTELIYTISDWKKLISDEDSFFSAESNTIFNNFMLAYMPKDFKLIEDIRIYKDDIDLMDALSEGEKKLILIKSVLEFIADERSLLLLDEPDANIHEERKRRLYNLLNESENRNIIMTSHSPTFVEIADDEQLYVLKKEGSYCIYDDDLNKIEQIRLLTGNRINIFSDKPILYCEGATNSLEAQLYPILFPEYTVVPSGGHTEVINNTKMFNSTFKNQNRAIGIIDGDYICEKQREALEEEFIYSLSVLEIENVLMDLSLIERAKEEFCADDDCIEKFKGEIIKDCNNRKNTMVTTYTKNYVVSKIVSEISTEGKKLDDFKKNIQDKTSNSFIEEVYNSRNSKIDSLLSENNLPELLKIIDFDHKIDRFGKIIVDNYQARIIRLIRKLEDLQTKIREKYYSTI